MCVDLDCYPQYADRVKEDRKIFLLLYNWKTNDGKERIITYIAQGGNISDLERIAKFHFSQNHELLTYISKLHNKKFEIQCATTQLGFRAKKW